MTHDTPPKQIWIAPVHDQWRSGTGEWMAEFWGLPTETPYILASHAEAMVAAALREAAEPLLKMRKGIEADVLSAHQNRGNGASEWMREDDRDFRRDLTTAFDTLALIPLPASAALDKLIAEAEARGMEKAAEWHDVRSKEDMAAAAEFRADGVDDGSVAACLADALCHRESAVHFRTEAAALRAAKGEPA